MAQLIEQIGTYRGKILDFAVSETTQKKLPQFVCQLQATQYYDEPNDEWIDIAAEDRRITAYRVLATLDESGIPIRCFPRDEVAEATGWDGITYSGLAAFNLKGRVITFRVVPHFYDGNQSLTVDKIGDENATFGLRKLSANKLKELDEKFKLADTPTTAKPVSAPPRSNPPKRPVTVETCTEDEAWTACEKANEALGKKAISGKELEDRWLNWVQDIAKNPEAVTDEEWARIRTAVLSDINIPF